MIRNIIAIIIACALAALMLAITAVDTSLVWDCGQDSTANNLDLETVGRLRPVGLDDSFGAFDSGVQLTGIDEGFRGSIGTLNWHDGFSATMAFDWQKDAKTNWLLMRLHRLNVASPPNTITAISVNLQDSDNDNLAFLAFGYRNVAETTVMTGGADSITVGKHALGIYYDGGATTRIYVDGALYLSVTITNPNTNAATDVWWFHNNAVISGELSPNQEFLDAGYDGRIWNTPPLEAFIIAQSDVDTAVGTANGDETAWYQFHCLATYPGYAVQAGLGTTGLVVLLVGIPAFMITRRMDDY